MRECCRQSQAEEVSKSMSKDSPNLGTAFKPTPVDPPSDTIGGNNELLDAFYLLSPSLFLSPAFSALSLPSLARLVVARRVTLSHSLPADAICSTTFIGHYFGGGGVLLGRMEGRGTGSLFSFPLKRVRRVRPRQRRGHKHFLCSPEWGSLFLAHCFRFVVSHAPTLFFLLSDLFH